MHDQRSRTMRAYLVAVTLSILAAIVPLLAAEDAGRSLLERTATFYEGLSKVRATMEVRFEMPEGMPAMPMEPEQFRVTLAWPERISAIPLGDPPGPSLVQDGEQQYADMPMFQRYTLKEPVPLEELAANPETASMMVPGLDVLVAFGLDAKKPMSLRGNSGVKLLGEESVDGVACDHLALTAAMGKSEIWIARGDRPWVMRHRQAPPEQPPLPEKNEKDGMMMFMPGVDIHFREWDADPDLSGAFRIDPRDDCKKVEVLMPPPDQMGDLMVEMEGPHPSIGKSAPEATLKPMGGETIKLSSLRGKVVVLDFWATWCAPCIIELPLVNKVTSELSDRGVVFYSVNRGDSAKIVESFVKERKFDFPVVLDRGDKISAAFGVVAMPHLVVIDRAGKVHSVHLGSGPGSENRLKAELESLLGR